MLGNIAAKANFNKADTSPRGSSGLSGATEEKLDELGEGVEEQDGVWPAFGTPGPKGPDLFALAPGGHRGNKASLLGHATRKLLVGMITSPTSTCHDFVVNQTIS